MSNTKSQSIQFIDENHARTVREVFANAGFTDAAVLELMGGQDVTSITAKDPSEQLYRTQGGSPLEVLVRLFLISVPVDKSTVERVLQPSEQEGLLRAGIIQFIDDTQQFTGTVNILPFKELLLVYDMRATLQGGSEDFVMGLGKSSLTLANLTVRRHSRQTLDLGAGGGIQALMAAGHSEKVIATDRNPRAVQFAGFNAQLNNFPHIHPREGNLFEPVTGESFDLVVTNPPFVISPERQYIYRDSGLKGDEVCEKIVREVSQYLAEGGYCVMLCNWAHLAGQGWEDRLAQWVQGCGCDTLVMRSETSTPEIYASTWIKHTELADAQHFTERHRQWLDYYKRQGIEQISAGVIVIRRRSPGSPGSSGPPGSPGPANWFETQDTPKSMLGGCGEEIVRRFEARDFLDSVVDDVSLMRSPVRLSPDARLIHTCEPASDDGWSITGLELTRTKGFVYHDKLDPPMANLLGRCNGERLLGQLIGELAQEIRQDRDTVALQILPIIRQIIRRGILVPVRSK